MPVAVPIDLLQVHFPWSISSIPAQMREMAALVRAGKTRAVGVSNFSASQMAKAGAALQAEGLTLASNQVRINLLERGSTNGVLELAREHRVTLIAYSPLAQGVLTGRYHDDPALARALPYGRRSRLSPSSRFLTPEGLARSAPAHRGAARRGREARGHARPGLPGLAGRLLRRGRQSWRFPVLPARSRPPRPRRHWTSRSPATRSRTSTGSRRQSPGTEHRRRTIEVGWPALPTTSKPATPPRSRVRLVHADAVALGVLEEPDRADHLAHVLERAQESRRLPRPPSGACPPGPLRRSSRSGSGPCSASC